jgi:hypothetical protein
MEIFVNDHQIDMLYALDKVNDTQPIKRTSSEYRLEMENTNNFNKELIETVRCAICYYIMTSDRQPC